MALAVALLGVRVLVLVAALDASLGRAVDAVALRMVSSDHGKSRCQRKRTELAAAGALSEARPVRWCALWQRRLRLNLKPRRRGSSGLASVRTAVRQGAAAYFVLGYRTSGHWQNRVILLCQKGALSRQRAPKGERRPSLRVSVTTLGSQPEAKPRAMLTRCGCVRSESRFKVAR